MSEEELVNETTKLEESIYQIFKRVIDDSINYSNINNFDEVDTYIHIQRKLEQSYEIMSNLLNTSTNDISIWLINHLLNKNN